MSEVPIVRDPSPEADRAKPGVLVAVALVSMLVGFLVVWLPGRRGDDARTVEGPSAPVKHGQEEAARQPVIAVAPRPVEDATNAPAVPAAAPQSLRPETAATPAAPALDAPDSAAAASGGGALRARAGDLYYWRCWDDGRDDPLPQDFCERLRAIEPMIQDGLESVAACARERGAGPGKLSLGLELNFTSKTIRYWGGRSSTVPNAADVAGCVRSRWHIDMDAIHHAHSRYTIFVPIDLVAH
jgi:hypothetical protein